MPAGAISLLMLMVLLAIAGCTPGLNAAGEPTAVPGGAVQIPDQAQAYVEQSQAALAERLGINADAIELESITEPADGDGATIIKLLADGEVYEYHGRNGEVLVPYETSVSPGVEVKELPAGEHSVIVNDQVTETFTLEPDDGESEAASGSPTVAIDLDETVATAVTVHNRPAVTATAEMPHWAAYPEHVEVEFEGYAHAQSLHPARIYVYPVTDYTEVSEIAAEQTFTLSELLVKKATVNEEKTLPFLPVLNAQSLMHTRGQYLDFSNGSGIRYLTQFGQAAGPITNQELLYTFQGLTDDGTYYVAAIFPMAQADLPANQASADAGFSDGFDVYIADVKAALETAAPATFTPNLETLDELVSSIEVEAQ